MNMNCLIVEDNPTAFTYLKQQLVKIDASACSNDTMVDSLSKLRQALANQSSYDIIFMDIKLLDGVCFDVLKEMPISCPIVFTTAFNEFAVDAFENNGVAYLMKPIQEDKLKIVIEKAIIMNAGTNVLKKLAEEGSSDTTSAYIDHFFINDKRGVSFVECNDIVYFETDDGRHCTIHTTDGKDYVYDKSLSSFINQLNPELFFSASRNYCVALQYVKSIERTITRGGEITMSYVDGYIPISRDKRKQLIDIIGQREADLKG